MGDEGIVASVPINTVMIAFHEPTFNRIEHAFPRPVFGTYMVGLHVGQYLTDRGHKTDLIPDLVHFYRQKSRGLAQGVRV